MPRGFTFIELIIVLVVSALVMATLVPRTAPLLDRASVSRATSEVEAFFRVARWSATYHGSTVRLQFDSDSLVAIFEGPPDSVFLTLPGPAHLGVQMTASRSTVRVQPTGVGLGAANARIVLRRGSFADSLATSRLGRIRRIR